MIILHNNMTEIVDFVSNDIPDALHFSDDEFTEHFYGASATFDFKISKWRNGKLLERIDNIRDDGYVSFVHADRTMVFIIKRLVETDYDISVYCETFNLELLNEKSYDFSSGETPLTFAEVMDSMNFLKNARLEIGTNEVYDVKRVVSFDSEETVLARILSIAEIYGGEVEFVTNIQPNGELDYIKINIYKRRTLSSPDTGVGRNRTDVRLFFGRDVEGITRTIDKENLFTGLRIKDKDGNYFKFTKRHSIQNENGDVEIVANVHSHTLYAPIAMRKYPSTIKRNSCDNWIIREMKVDDVDEELVWLQASEKLREYMYPHITYDVRLSSFQILNRYDLRIGDTIYITDDSFRGNLIISARVIKITRSQTNPLLNTIELSNFVTLTSKVSNNLLSEMRRLNEESAPYAMQVKTDNGLTFKEYTGTSTITPELVQNGKIVANDVTYLYYVDGTYVATGETFSISPQVMKDDKSVVYVEAIYKNNMVASVELTFFNVNDGKSPILLHIDTSNGNIFKNNIISSTLTARLWRGEEEIDIEGGAFEYIWSKVNDDGTLDEDWNAQHRTSSKKLVITSADVYRRGTFTCDVTPIY